MVKVTVKGDIDSKTSTSKTFTFSSAAYDDYALDDAKDFATKYLALTTLTPNSVSRGTTESADINE